MMKSLIAIIGIIAAGGIFFLFTKPTYDSVQSIRAQSAVYDEALSKATELQQLGKTLTTKYNSFNPDDIAKLEKLLPDHVDNVRLILDLDSLAQKHGMALQNVDVTSPDSSQSSSGSIGSLTATKQKYDSIIMQFSTQGSYADFLSFLTDLEQSLRIVDLVSLKLQPVNSGTVGGPLVYSYDVTLRTYWLK